MNTITKCSMIVCVTAVTLMEPCNLKECGAQVRVKTGIEVLAESDGLLLQGKRAGLITNPTGITSALESTIDVLNRLTEVELVALFGPEHGVRGDVFAGEKIADYRDGKTGLPVYSLYGQTRKPTPAMLENVDVLIYDIQDIGSRAYTYIYTMALSMEAARDRGIPFVVLDRPNPLGGTVVEGPVLDPAFKSFIGLYPIPYIYGLTVGELASLFNSEFGIGCELSIVEMEGWKRSMLFADTGLPWVPTSPHIPQAQTSLYCATTGCIGELGTLCEGVGYTSPFELLAAEWTSGDELADELNSHALPGVRFRPLYFRPYYFRYKDVQLHGIQIHIIDPVTFRPMRTQIALLVSLHKLYPKSKFLESERTGSFDRAMGTDTVRKAILSGKSADEIIAAWKGDLDKFMIIREKYIIYQ